MTKKPKITWSCGVTVSTLDSESSDGGSNPPRTFFDTKLMLCVNKKCCGLPKKIVDAALLAQWLERAAVNRKVTGSIPVGSVFANVAFRTVAVSACT